jgi:hypothetical protein
MPDRLAAAYQINARLQASLARMETPTTTRRTLPVMRHRVEGQIVADVAWPRYLVWRSYIMSRRPTPASRKRAAHRLRGEMLARYALWAQAQGKPLPTNHTPPALALNPIATRMQQPTHTRKDLEKWLNPDEFGGDVPDDMAAWWDEYGWDSGLDAEQMSDFTRGASESLARQRAAEEFEFQRWLNEDVFTNMQVLQLLESYWNGQSAMFAGSEVLTAAGVAGDFDLTDPAMMDFLRYQAGNFIQIGTQNIDERTRQILGEYLWSGLGGDISEGVPYMSMDALAKYIQSAMTNEETSLANMSDYRARMIAVTETARAESMGQFVSMLSLGVKQKQWMTTTGACTKCADNELQGPVPILDPYPSGDMGPPAHPLCRCSSAPWVDTRFNPNEWQAPSPADIARLFNDPSFAQWPKQVANLSDPALKMDIVPVKFPANFNLVGFDNLPESLQMVLRGDALGMNKLQTSVGQVIANRAANIAASVGLPLPPIDEDAPNFGAVTLDELLAEPAIEQLDLTDRQQSIVSTIDDIMAQLRQDAGNEGE